jgi:hypothetical protein
LTDHIKVCAKHPLRAAEATISKLRSALAGLVGSDDKAELEAVEAMTRTYMTMGNVPQKDGVAMINAIHVLLETKEESPSMAKESSAPEKAIEARLTAS